MNSAEQLLLRIDGMPQKTIDEIEAATPHVAALVKMVKDNMPLAQKIAAVFTEVQPLFAQVAPLIAPALGEIQAVLPAADDVLAFLKEQQGQLPAAPQPGSTPDTA